MTMHATADLTRHELVSILDIIEGAAACSSEDCLKRLILEVREVLEADFSICGLVRKRGLEPLETASIINGSYPDSWLERYVTEKMFLTDPVVRHHTHFSDTVLWKDLPESDDSAERNITMAMDHGIRFGLSGSIYLPERNDIALFAFSGPRDSFGDRHSSILDTLSRHLGRTLTRMTYGNPDGEKPPEGRLLY